MPKLFDPKFDPNTTTLAKAQQVLKDHALKGAICPCCRQEVRMYTREITSTMAYSLIILHRHFSTNKDWLHVPKFLSQMSAIGSAVRGGDFAKLRYWGLLEAKQDAKTEKKPQEKRKDGSKRVGFYRMTEKGHQFAKGEIKVPKAALIYNRKHHGFAPGEATIQECLGKEFNYADLMAGQLGGFVV
jgi:hypothetical protein